MIPSTILLGKWLFPEIQFITSSRNTKKTKCIENIIGRGRKRKTSIHLDRIVQRKVKVDWWKSASSVKIDIESELGITISEQTVRRCLLEIGLKGRVTRKKPYVNKVNRGKRLEYGKTYREKPLGYWDNVLWTDESKFNLFESDGKVTVWRTPKGELDPKCTVPTRDAPVRLDWVPVGLGIQSDWIPVRLGTQSPTGTQSDWVTGPTGSALLINI